MKHWKKLVMVVGVVAVLSLLFPRTTYAYIDPGTGSLIVQVLVGALVSGLAAVGIFWQRVKGFFGGLFNKQRDDKDNK